MRRLLQFVAIALLALGSRPAFAVSPNVVISQFQPQGAGGGDDELVELYNATGRSVDLSDWSLWAANSAGTASARVVFPSGATIGAAGYLLLANAATTQSVVPDYTYSTAFTNSGGLRLLNGVTVVDAVGATTATSAYREGSGLTIPGTAVSAFTRKSLGGCVLQDTDDNAADFTGPATVTYRNSSSGCGACANVVCDSPPNEGCYDAVGDCHLADGVCAYTAKATGVGCDDGDTCTSGDACDAGVCTGSAVTCNAPPQPACSNPTTLTTYAASGTCEADGCVYVGTPTTCPFNCVDGACTDPCTGVVCDAPPAVCDGDAVRTYGVGTCGSNGVCNYPSTLAACASGCDDATVTCRRAPTDDVDTDTPAPSTNDGGCAAASSDNLSLIGCLAFVVALRARRVRRR